MTRLSKQRREVGLAAIADIRRRLAANDFSDVDVPPDQEAEVADIDEARRAAYQRKYDSTHPVLAPRRDIN